MFLLFFCCTILPLWHYHKLGVMVVAVTALVSYFELGYFFSGGR